MTTSQPSGTVTLVFTDIEGSTRLLDELGVDGYRAALAEHRRIVRDACARHDGYEVDYEGDAFFYAFATAQAAVAAVSEAMIGLDGGPIRIRVGIHTGAPTPDPPKYVEYTRNCAGASGLTMVTKTSALPSGARESAPAVVGKSGDWLTPATNALPRRSTAIPLPRSLPIPPRYVEYTRALPSGGSFVTNASKVAGSLSVCIASFCGNPPFKLWPVTYALPD